MSYFAANNTVATSTIEGGIEITLAQYDAGVEAMISGREVVVIGGSMVIRDTKPSANHEWVDGEWLDMTPEPEPPTPYQPRTTAMWRARAISKVTTHSDGTLFDAINSAIAAIDDNATRAAAEEAWERGTVFNLDGQLVPLIMDAVGGLTEADVLDLILQSEQLPA